MVWAQSAAPDSAAFGSQSGIVSADVDVSGRSAADECRQTALGSMAPEQIKKLQAYWGVGVPVWKRFFSWISGICHGDFGISLLYRRPVLEVIAEKASASVWLLLSAWLFSGIVGIFLGIAAAAKRGKWVDRLITGYCIVIAGTPSFWLALVLLLLFTVQLPIFPIGSVSRWEWRRTRSAWRIACITHFCRRVRWD